jgi:paraquat-inducible protein B
MAKQVSKTVIGGFVISGIVMLIAGVIILGSGALFKKTQKYVMFFEKSVKGLRAGRLAWRGDRFGQQHCNECRSPKTEHQCPCDN